MDEKTVLQAHGVGLGNNSDSDSDSGKSSFDDEYYKHMPIYVNKVTVDHQNSISMKEIYQDLKKLFPTDSKVKQEANNIQVIQNSNDKNYKYILLKEHLLKYQDLNAIEKLDTSLPGVLTTKQRKDINNLKKEIVKGLNKRKDLNRRIKIIEDYLGTKTDLDFLINSDLQIHNKLVKVEKMLIEANGDKNKDIWSRFQEIKRLTGNKSIPPQKIVSDKEFNKRKDLNSRIKSIICYIEIYLKTKININFITNSDKEIKSKLAQINKILIQSTSINTQEFLDILSSFQEVQRLASYIIGNKSVPQQNIVQKVEAVKTLGKIKLDNVKKMEKLKNADIKNVNNVQKVNSIQYIDSWENVKIENSEKFVNKTQKPTVTKKQQLESDIKEMVDHLCKIGNFRINYDVITNSSRFEMEMTEMIKTRSELEQNYLNSVHHKIKLALKDYNYRAVFLNYLQNVEKFIGKKIVIDPFESPKQQILHDIQEVQESFKKCLNYLQNCQGLLPLCQNEMGIKVKPMLDITGINISQSNIKDCITLIGKIGKIYVFDILHSNFEDHSKNLEEKLQTTTSGRTACEQIFLNALIKEYKLKIKEYNLKMDSKHKLYNLEIALSRSLNINVFQDKKSNVFQKLRDPKLDKAQTNLIQKIRLTVGAWRETDPYELNFKINYNLFPEINIERSKIYNKINIIYGKLDLVFDVNLAKNGSREIVTKLDAILEQVKKQNGSFSKIRFNRDAMIKIVKNAIQEYNDINEITEVILDLEFLQNINDNIVKINIFKDSNDFVIQNLKQLKTCLKKTDSDYIPKMSSIKLQKIRTLLDKLKKRLPNNIVESAHFFEIKNKQELINSYCKHISKYVNITQFKVKAYKIDQQIESLNSCFTKCEIDIYNKYAKIYQEYIKDEILDIYHRQDLINKVIYLESYIQTTVNLNPFKNTPEEMQNKLDVIESLLKKSNVSKTEKDNIFKELSNCKILVTVLSLNHENNFKENLSKTLIIEQKIKFIEFLTRIPCDFNFKIIDLKSVDDLLEYFTYESLVRSKITDFEITSVINPYFSDIKNLLTDIINENNFFSEITEIIGDDVKTVVNESDGFSKQINDLIKYITNSDAYTTEIKTDVLTKIKEKQAININLFHIVSFKEIEIKTKIRDLVENILTTYPSIDFDLNVCSIKPHMLIAYMQWLLNRISSEPLENMLKEFSELDHFKTVLSILEQDFDMDLGTLNVYENPKTILNRLNALENALKKHSEVNFIKINKYVALENLKEVQTYAEYLSQNYYDIRENTITDNSLVVNFKPLTSNTTLSPDEKDLINNMLQNIINNLNIFVDINVDENIMVDDIYDKILDIETYVKDLTDSDLKNREIINENIKSIKYILEFKHTLKNRKCQRYSFEDLMYLYNSEYIYSDFVRNENNKSIWVKHKSTYIRNILTSKSSKKKNPSLKSSGLNTNKNDASKNFVQCDTNLIVDVSLPLESNNSELFIFDTLLNKEKLGIQNEQSKKMQIIDCIPKGDILDEGTNDVLLDVFDYIYSSDTEDTKIQKSVENEEPDLKYTFKYSQIDEDQKNIVLNLPYSANKNVFIERNAGMDYKLDLKLNSVYKNTGISQESQGKPDKKDTKAENSVANEELDLKYTFKYSQINEDQTNTIFNSPHSANKNVSIENNKEMDYTFDCKLNSVPKNTEMSKESECKPDNTQISPELYNFNRVTDISFVAELEQSEHVSPFHYENILVDPLTKPILFKPYDNTEEVDPWLPHNLIEASNEKVTQITRDIDLINLNSKTSCLKDKNVILNETPSTELNLNTNQISSKPEDYNDTFKEFTIPLGVVHTNKKQKLNQKKSCVIC